MRIINISKEEAKSKYNKDCIDRVIETYCVKILQRILADPQHPITSKIPRIENRRSSTRYQITKLSNTVKVSSHLSCKSSEAETQTFIQHLKPINIW